MSDDWQRPDGPDPAYRPVEDSIEVPLSGDGPLAGRPEAQADQPDPPNWRRIIWVSSLAGVALGILLSIVLINVVWDDDDPSGGIAGDPSTTIDGLDLSTLITTPPTLDPQGVAPPVETAPRPRVTLNLPTTTLAPVPESLQTYGTLPDYPSYTGIPEGGLDSFDLAAAVAAFEEDVARSSDTHYEVGGPDNTLRATIVRDPINNRYGLTLQGFGGTLQAVVDLDAGITYVTDDGETWVQWDNDDMITGVSADELGDYFDGLMFGPVRPDTLGSAVVTPLPLVFFEGSDRIAREFAVELPGDIVPEWQYYAFSPAVTFPDELRPEWLNYLAYVDQGGNLSRVIGSATIGDVTQLMIHQVERLEFPEIVLTPDPARVVVRPTVST